MAYWSDDFISYWNQDFPEGEQKIYMIENHGSSNVQILHKSYIGKFKNWLTVAEYIHKNRGDWEMDSIYDKEKLGIDELQQMFYSLSNIDTYNRFFFTRNCNPFFNWLKKIDYFK